MPVPIGILIGGASSRMGHPKALLMVDGTTLLQRTVAVARAISPDVLLLGEPRFEIPIDLLALPRIPDRHPGSGPIGGLDALFAARPRSDVLLLACDMPAITANLLQRLTLDPAHDAAVFTTPDGRSHPCCALYSSTVAGVVADRAAGSQLAMMNLLGCLRVKAVPLIGIESVLVRNVNQPSDVA